MEFYPYNPADRFTRLIDELCRVLTRHGAARFIQPPMLLLIWNRITRLGRLFAALVELVRADRHAMPARPRRRTTPKPPPPWPDPARPGPSPTDPPPVLPQHRRWLVNLLPEAEHLGPELCWLLDQPEMRELIDAAPQVGRILRPLCRMLGVEPPPLLWLPRRPRVRKPQPTPRPAPQRPIDDGMWPQWRGPSPLWPNEDVFWKFHPRSRGDPPSRD